MADKLVLRAPNNVSNEEKSLFWLNCQRALLIALQQQQYLDEITLRYALELLEKKG